MGANEREAAISSIADETEKSMDTSLSAFLRILLLVFLVSVGIHELLGFALSSC